jgi:hypothetical protein
LAEKSFKDIAAQRYTENDAFFIRLFDDSEFGKYITDRFVESLYNKLRNDYKETPGGLGAKMAAEP